MSGTLVIQAASEPAPAESRPGGGGLRQRFSWYEPWRISRGGLMLVIAAHLLLFWVLLQARNPSPVTAATSAPVLSVSLIAPKVAVAPPRVETPPPQPVPPRKIEIPHPRPKVLTSHAPATETSSRTAPLPENIEPTPPAATPQPSAPEPAAAGPAPQPQPPRFDAAYLDNPSPVYPRLSRRMGEQGKTLLLVQVSAEGKALQVELQRSSGSSRLDQAAIEAVRQWRFVPARLGNSQVAASVIVPIIFALQN